eukprot:SM000146S00944  [mRNA]  locus=s146:35360:44700:- [translate_table: standard]
MGTHATGSAAHLCASGSCSSSSSAYGGAPAVGGIDGGAVSEQEAEGGELALGGGEAVLPSSGPPIGERQQQWGGPLELAARPLAVPQEGCSTVGLPLHCVAVRQHGLDPEPRPIHEAHKHRRAGAGCMRPRPPAARTVRDTDVRLPPLPQLDARAERLLARSRQLAAAWRFSPYYLEKPAPRPVGLAAEIERYSDKYKPKARVERAPLSSVLKLTPAHFPAQLLGPDAKRRKRAAPSTAQWRQHAASAVNDLQRLDRLATLEQKVEREETEKSAATKDEKKAEEGDGDGEEGEGEEEEEEEEFGDDDYAQTYGFDDDEGYMDADDGDDGRQKLVDVDGSGGGLDNHIASAIVGLRAAGLETWEHASMLELSIRVILRSSIGCTTSSREVGGPPQPPGPVVDRQLLIHQGSTAPRLVGEFDCLPAQSFK